MAHELSGLEGWFPSEEYLDYSDVVMYWSYNLCFVRTDFIYLAIHFTVLCKLFIDK